MISGIAKVGWKPRLFTLERGYQAVCATIGAAVVAAG